MEKKRLIWVGKGGSGKDHARKISENIIGAKYAVSYTSRPPREGEVEGVDKTFCTFSQAKYGLRAMYY
jgi:guanylate kinase